MDVTCEDKRKGEISEELVRLHDKKEQLHVRIGVLFDRLQELLSKSEPQNEACQPQQQPLQSQFAIDLSGISSTIETDLEKINDIINRLEL